MSDKKEPEERSEDRPSLEQGEAVPTSRVGRFLRTGWAARHAVPLALKRTAELVSAEKKDRKETLEALMLEQEAVAEELFRTLGNLKGVVQKFGQMASYLEGVLPEEVAPVYQKVLSRLQDAAPALPPLASQKVIEDELDCFLEDHFDTFEERPFAAASVGQVHRATLYDGTRVAVKVQYPDIDKAFSSDLKNMKMLEMLFAPVIHYYQGKETLESLRQQLLDELDYQREADAQERFQAMFADHPKIHIPKVFRELSTQKVLVTEFVEGMSFEEIRQADEEVRLLAAESLAQYYLESVHIHHFTNVDPHPGNYIFHEDGRISCLDFGAAVPVDPALVLEIDKLLLAILDHDIPALHEAMFAIFGIPRDVDPVILDAHTTLLLYIFAPFLPEKQPFHMTTGWVSSCFDEGMDAAKQILLRGGKIPKLPPPPSHVHPDLSILSRILLGLGSLLARLDVRRDWSPLFPAVMAKKGS